MYLTDSIDKKQYKLFDFEVSNNVLTSTVIEGSFEDKMKLGTITVMGISKVVKQVFFNNKDVEFEYDKEKSVSYYYNCSCFHICLFLIDHILHRFCT